jgi:anti-sigma factor RsiW
MNCKEVNNNMLSFLEGNLNQEKESKMKMHLSGCSTCEKNLAKVKSIYQIIDEDKDSVEPNPFLATKVWEKVQSQKTSIEVPIIPLKRATIIYIAAAGIAFGIVIGSLLNTTLPHSENGGQEEYWTQLADDYFPNEVFSPYEQLDTND